MPSGLFGWHFTCFEELCVDGSECLLQIFDNIISIFQTDRQTDKARGNASVNQLLIAELAMGGGSRM